MLKKKFFKTKTECEVVFELSAKGAQQVELVCEFNSWEPIEMKKNRQGAFRTKLRLPRARQFQFRYLVDQRVWVTDEDADGCQPNQFGGKNSILDTSPPELPS